MNCYPKQYYASAYINLLARTAERLSCPDYLVSGLHSVDISQQRSFVDAKLPDVPVIDCYQNTPNLSFEFGRDMTLESHGFLGYAVKSSKNVSQTFDMWSRYLKSRISLIDLSLDDSDSNYLIINVDFYGMASKRIEFFFEAFVTSLFSITGQITSLGNLPSEFEVTFERPDHSKLYDLYFMGCNVTFNSPRNRIIIKRDLLENYIPTNDPVLLKLCESQCQSLISKLPTSSTLKDSIIQYFDKFGSKLPALPELAKYFAASERTLKRKLESEGVTYRQIQEEYKDKKSRELLLKSDTNLSIVADSLGYADLSGFVRAFKRWHQGMSPAQYRKEFSEKFKKSTIG